MRVSFAAAIATILIGAATLYSQRAQALDLGDLLPARTAQTAREVQRAAMEAQRAAAQAQRDAEKTQRQQAESEGCTQLKAWVSSAPSAVGSRRPEDFLPLLDDARFVRYFGAPYDQLTIADFRRLQQVQSACPREGSLTPGEMQTVRYLLNPSTHAQLSRQLGVARSQRDETRSLLAELDGLQATDDDLRRLDAISARLTPLLRTASPEDGRAAQAKLAAARERIAAPVYASRLDRLVKEARGVEGITALAGLQDGLGRSGLSGESLESLRRRAQDRINELSVPIVREERAAIAGLGKGLPGLERGVGYYGAFTTKYQKSLQAVPELDAVRRDLLSNRAVAIAAAQTELQAEIQKAKNESEINAVLGRYLLDVERQQAGRIVAGLASDRVGAMRRDAENERAFGPQAEKVAQPSSQPAGKSGRSASSATGVLSDPAELRKYEAAAIVRSIYFADLAGLKDDAIFTRKYLIAQASHLGENCDTFKVSEIRSYETRFQKQVITAVNQNMGQILRDSVRSFAAMRDNPSLMVDAGAQEQRREDAPELAVRDIERLATKYGGCDSDVIRRYTKNLRGYLENAR